MAGGFFRNTRGGIATLVALMMPVLIGALGLGAETGWWYMLQRQAQHGADMAAYSAAVQLARRNDAARARAAAETAAHGSGLSPDTATVEVTVTGEDRVVVVVTDTRPRIFTRLFLDGPVTIRARAVAAIVRDDEGVPVCMLALDPTGDRAVWLDGSADIDLGPCAIEARSTSASAFFSGGASSLVAGCLNVVGGAQGNPVVTTVCDRVNTNAIVRGVPVQLLALEQIPGAAGVATYSGNRISGSFTPSDTGHPSGVPMARFDGGVTLQGTVTLGRGVYIIDGGTLSTQGWTDIDASAGIAIYLINGAQLDFGNNTTADLQAMRDGPWQNVLVFDSQDTASARTHVLVGSRVTGAIYTPRATIEFRGGTGVDDGCFMMVMARLYFTGSADISADCAASFFDLDTFGMGGGAAGPGTIELVE